MAALFILGIFALLSLVILIMMVTGFAAFVMTRVPFVPTAAVDLELLVRRGLITKNDVVYDLGSGNGKTLFLFEQLGGATGVGFELTAWAHWYAWVKKIVLRSKMNFVLGDFFRHNLSPATVVYCYLYPPLMRRVGEKILSDCRPGTRVISRDFPIPNLPLIDHFATTGKHEVFIYKV